MTSEPPRVFGFLSLTSVVRLHHMVYKKESLPLHNSSEGVNWVVKKSPKRTHVFILEFKSYKVQGYLKLRQKQFPLTLMPQKKWGK